MSTTDFGMARMNVSDALPRLPDVRFAHWLPRLLLAAIILQQGYIKFPLLASDAAGYGVPYFMWGLAALGELFAGMALIIGGLIKSRLGDIITRTGAALLALIVASVIVVVYWAPPLDLFLGNQTHLLLLAGGLYFAFRGNNA
ncbi:MAG: DoxX family protein [Pseudomonadota bacterium]